MSDWSTRNGRQALLFSGIVCFRRGSRWVTSTGGDDAVHRDRTVQRTERERERENAAGAEMAAEVEAEMMTSSAT